MQNDKEEKTITKNGAFKRHWSFFYYLAGEEPDIPALTAKQFKDISAEALDAAVRLVSITADVSKESLLDVYRQWCDSGSFDSSGLDLPIPVEEAEDDWMLDDPQDQDKKEVSDLFQVLEGHVEKQKPGADEPMANMEADTTADMPECEQHGFGNVPDLEELKKCCEPGPPPPELDPKQKKCFLPRTLPEALQLHSNGRDLFDAVWRLTTFLRHGHLNPAFSKIFRLLHMKRFARSLVDDELT